MVANKRQDSITKIRKEEHPLDGFCYVLVPLEVTISWAEASPLTLDQEFLYECDEETENGRLGRKIFDKIRSVSKCSPEEAILYAAEQSMQDAGESILNQ